MYSFTIRYLGTLLCLFCTSVAIAQSTIKGQIVDQVTGESLSNASVYIQGSGEGTISDRTGHFTLTTHHAFPLTLVISFVGYKTQNITLQEPQTSLNIQLVPTEILGRETIISASRVPERIIESPVSIERLNNVQLKQAAAPDFYNAIGNLKGVNVVNSGLLFPTLTTRGFAASGNTSVNQFLDGMNTEAPGLNFSVGNVIGVNDLDLDNVELLPGAASALYGAGGTNGTILITSKDPFLYQGISALVKEGVMHVNDPEHGATLFQEYEARYAQAFQNKWAFKLNFDYIKGYDWIADDTSNYDAQNFTVKAGSRATDPAYDGVNVYGDEITVNIHDVAQQMAQAGVISPQAASQVPNQNVTRTGYREKYLVDYNTYNLKLSGMLAYKITPKITASLTAYYGSGTTVYTGSDRYSLNHFHIGMYKAQIKGEHFNLFGYTTQEDAGKSYNATVLGELINEAWKPSTTWYPQFVGAYLQAKQQGAPDALAFQIARAYADQGMPAPTDVNFGQYKDQVNSSPIPQGSRFIEHSSLWHYEGFYDFSYLTQQVVDLQAGISYNRYHLNSKGTLFDDQSKKLTIDQYGFFLQASRKLIHERLRLIASARYDKNQNFEGKLTPRFAAVITVAPNNTIRLSYQTGYKLPTNQNQYIDLNVGRARLIGGLPQFINKYNLINNPGFTVDNVNQYAAAYQAAYIANLQQGQSQQQAQYNAAVTAEKVLQPYVFKTFKPETVYSYELGYRGIIHQVLMIDAYVYAANYKDFFGSVFLIQAKNGPQQIIPQDPNKYYGPQLASDQTRNVYQVTVNSEGRIKTFGWAIGVDYQLPHHYLLSGNLSYNKLNGAPAGFFTQFNTPDYQANMGFSNPDVFHGWGFDIHWRYQNAFLYQGSFAVGQVPAFSTLDAAISYRLVRQKLLFKLGGTNILNHYYQNAFGNPKIGALYYVSVGYNVF
ncbi:TonB-dependent receptor [Thermoflavifilum thermophilum]|uniref:TonB-dependent Receptor Plug Domain n=1 Tax=Thermoflavifilum thermophilum TaxID=1393122 RepID=A0A1I7NK04_9BACT|nr:TonB-dependent receptor [Thermoflavifilum thermophilum]SFV34896.1 TonB-dependent Receptor Plug Domain [Thermoflavifilum thermophilum]